MEDSMTNNGYSDVEHGNSDDYRRTATAMVEAEHDAKPTPLDRAARALCLAQSGVDDFDALDEGMQQTLRENAAAVLRAVRGPSEGMVEAASAANEWLLNGEAKYVWQAMIDAALTES